MAPPTLKDVARKAGVAVATASYALSGKGTISTETRQRVQGASVALGYRPNTHARRLRHADTTASSTQNLGIVLVESRPQDPIYIPLIQRFSQQVQESECHPLVLTCPSTISRPEELPFTLRQRNLDGFLLNGNLNECNLSLFRQLDVPFVVLGNHRVPPEISIIRTEVMEGVLTGMEHLLRLGHRRIGLVSEVLDSPYHRDILHGYEEALMQAGIVPVPEHVQISASIMTGGRDQAERLLALDAPPTAILVTDYRIACDVTRTVEQAGLQPGRDLSIITLAGQYEQGFTPALTCIRDQIDQIVDEGLRCLDAHLKDASTPPRRASIPCLFDLGTTTASLLPSR